MSTLSIIIPVYNEEDSITTLKEEFQQVCRINNYQYELIFLNDGSTDKSREILTQICRAEEHIKVISLKRNYGQTAALSAGLDAAKGDIIVTPDADLQNDPADIPKLIAKLHEGYDLVNGWRRKRQDPLFSKIIPSVVANLLIRKITNVQIHDTGCSLKAFKKSVLEDLHLYGEMHRFIPALVHWNGGSNGEVEVNHRKRSYGESKYGFSRLPRVILDLFNLKFLIGYSTSPIQLFGKIGLYTFFFSLLSFISLISMKIFWKTDMTGNPFLMLTIFLGFIGVQFIVMGMLGEIIIRTYHETTKGKIYKIAGQ